MSSTSQKIAAQLEAAEQELKALRDEQKCSKTRSREVSNLIVGLIGNHCRDGMIYRLKADLENAKDREKFNAGRTVRVCPKSKWDEPKGLCFDRATPKRIYLRYATGSVAYWGMDGSSQCCEGPIHPDDLALILAGETDKFPLVSAPASEVEGKP